MFHVQLIVEETVEGLKERLGSFFFEVVSLALKERGKALVGVSGGSMPSMVAPLISKLPIDWSLVTFFAVDERMVSLEDKESNTGAYLRLLPEHFKKYFLEYGPIENCAKCAENYADKLLKCNPPMIDGWPQFDLLLLGHGPDGHTCSLFPSHSLLQNASDLIAYIEDSPKPPPRRITLTLTAINHARNIAFISTGESKSEILKALLDDQDQNLPAALVRPISGTVYWFLDAAAASKLDKRW